MSTTTSIFTFDHGQKKLNKAIGVEESYLEDLQEKIGNTLRDYLFDENKDMRDDLSPSILVEKCLQEFSYSQLVIMSSFYLKDTLRGFAERMEERVNKVKATVKRIALDSDDIPDHIKEALINLARDGKGNSKDNAINGDDLPQEIKDFLDNLARNAEDADEDDED